MGVKGGYTGGTPEHTLKRWINLRIKGRHYHGGPGCPPLISDECFNAAQAKLASNTRVKTNAVKAVDVVHEAATATMTKR